MAPPEPSIPDMTLRQALFYAEHPDAVPRDFGERSKAAEDRIDALIGAARAERPLVWQAYVARRARRPHVGTVDAARIIKAATDSGHRPVAPPDRLPDASDGESASVRRLDEPR